MEAANKALAVAEGRLAACNEKLTDLQRLFDEQMSKKRTIEEGAMSLQKKMNQASALINGLAGERTRWTEDAANFSDQKKRLVGDCAIGCAFMSYCGPFNQQFRNYMINDKFTADCEARQVPVTRDLDVISFLADVGTIGDWQIDGLPTDPLSTQNGILVTSSSRFPLLVDPQGQALQWIQNKERSNLPTFNGQNIVDVSDPKLKDKLEFCMGDGKSLIIVGIEDEIDPMLDPVLEKEITKKGSRMYVNVSDKMMDYDPNFKMYFITRLEKHLYNGGISWGTFQYMVSDVQYGGKITDSLDVRLFRTYTKEWLTERTCEENFSFNPSSPICQGGNGVVQDTWGDSTQGRRR